MAFGLTGLAQAQQHRGEGGGRDGAKVDTPIVVHGAATASELHMQREGDRPVRPYAFEAMPVAHGAVPAKADAALAPPVAEKASARLTPEERRQLRQNIQEVGREVYRR